ncbi:hypothetical protein COCOBI_11-4680 [Coccomyxa sp. Obi]|nr:hypothetical protein COCOBI_11-4680 [Coccomyxa sp. Obi]
MSSDSNTWLWVPSPLTIVGVAVICVVGVVLLHFISRNIYLRAVRDQETATQPSPPVQLQQLPHDMEAQPVEAVEEPAKQAPTAVVLVLHPDNKVVCAVEQSTSGEVSGSSKCGPLRSKDEGMTKASTE